MAGLDLTQLIAVAFGFGLSEAARWFTDNRHQRESRRNVRVLLRQESDHNLGRLHALRGQVFQNVGFESFQEHVFQQCRALAEATVPDWSRLMWESQAGLLPLALSSDEIAKLYDRYDKLTALLECRKKLQDLFGSDRFRLLTYNYDAWQEQKQSLIAAGRPGSIEGNNVQPLKTDLPAFYKDASPIWQQCEVIFNTLPAPHDDELLRDTGH